jgi:predicted Zn-dependent protease
MPGFFYNLGKGVGHHLRKGHWLLQALTGEDTDVLEAEHRVGRDMAAQVEEMMASAPGAEPIDPRQAAWLDELAAALVVWVKDKRRRFRFTIVASGPPNAISLPGGFIFVERSLLELCQWDRDEAGFVLGHEMAHVIRGHTIERILGSDLIAMAARAVAGGGAHGKLIRQAASQFLRMAYSREQEFDADALGARLAAAGGCDQEGGPGLLGRLKARCATPDAADLGAYFASHPPLDERIGRLRRLLKT